MASRHPLFVISELLLLCFGQIILITEKEGNDLPSGAAVVWCKFRGRNSCGNVVFRCPGNRFFVILTGNNVFKGFCRRAFGFIFTSPKEGYKLSSCYRIVWREGCIGGAYGNTTFISPKHGIIEVIC